MKPWCADFYKASLLLCKKGLPALERRRSLTFLALPWARSCRWTWCKRFEPWWLANFFCNFFKNSNCDLGTSPQWSHLNDECSQWWWHKLLLIRTITVTTLLKALSQVSCSSNNSAADFPLSSASESSDPIRTWKWRAEKNVVFWSSGWSEICGMCAVMLTSYFSCCNTMDQSASLLLMKK